LTETSCRKRGLNYVTVALIDLRESHFVASDLAFSVEVSGLEPPTSTLRIQTGPLSDLGAFTQCQLNRHFD